MSLLNEKFTDVVRGDVRSVFLYTPSFSQMEMATSEISTPQFDVGATELRQVGTSMISYNNVTVQGSTQITGTMVVNTGVTSQVVIIPDAITLPHVFIFKNGLLSRYVQGFFICTVKTDNPGYNTASNQFRLPLVSSGSYDMVVRWGDGSVTPITQWDDPQKLHTYSVPGTYTIEIIGKCEGWSFGAVQGIVDPQKFINISRWGPDFNLGANLQQHFSNCVNLTITAPDALNLVGTKNLHETFGSCVGLTNVPSFNLWDVSQVTDMGYMFQNCQQFNTNIGNWDVSNVETMSFMFYNCYNFNNGGSPSIGNWSATKCTNFSNMFQQCTGLLQPLTNLVNTASLPQPGCTLFRMFWYSNYNQPIGTWNTSKVTEFSNMFESNSTFNQDIGAWDMSSAVYLNSMFWQATAFNNGGSPSIQNWTFPEAQNFYAMFYNASNFNQPLTNWLFPKASNLSYMFYNAYKFNQNLSTWQLRDTTPATGGLNLDHMFHSAEAFNNGQVTLLGTVTPSLCSYDEGLKTLTCPGASLTTVLNPGDSIQIVYNTNVFVGTVFSVAATSLVLVSGVGANINQGSVFNVMKPVVGTNPLTWNFKNVSFASEMFSNARSFNQHIGALGVDTDWGRVQELNSMFEFAIVFNNGALVGSGANPMNWITSNGYLNSMQQMFKTAYSYNSPMTASGGKWDISSCQNTYQMFQDAYRFNQNIGSWNFANLGTAYGMFDNARAFNNGGSADTVNWNAPNAYNLQFMFKNAVSFNQPVTNLVDTSAYSGSLNINAMFQNAYRFNNGQNTVVPTVDPLVCTYDPGTKTITCPGAALSTAILPPGEKIVVAYDQKTLVAVVQSVTATTIVLLASISPNPIVAGVIYNISKLSACYGTTPLQWKTEKVSGMEFLFQFATSFNQNLSQNGAYWKLGSVSLWFMFAFAYMFNNGDLYGSTTRPLIWDMRYVTNVSFLFDGCRVFNQTLSRPGYLDGVWNTRNVSSMQQMFELAVLFNNGQYTCISPVLPYAATITGTTLFYPGAGFNGVGAGATIVITTYKGRFTRTIAVLTNDNTVTLNSGLGLNYSVGEVVNVSLPAAIVPSKPLKLYNSNVTTCLNMFLSAQYFDQDLPYATFDDDGTTRHTWHNTSLDTCQGMFFNCFNFNSPLSTFKTNNVTNMRQMFTGTYCFNQPLTADLVNGYWDVRNVTNMSTMFSGAPSFKQSLASWSPFACNQFDNFLSPGDDLNDPNSATNQNNYNALLNSWGTNPKLAFMQSGSITFGRGSTSYTIATAGTARNNLIAKGWYFDPPLGGV